MAFGPCNVAWDTQKEKKKKQTKKKNSEGQMALPLKWQNSNPVCHMSEHSKKKKSCSPHVTKHIQSVLMQTMFFS